MKSWDANMSEYYKSQWSQEYCMDPGFEYCMDPGINRQGKKKVVTSIDCGCLS